MKRLPVVLAIVLAAVAAYAVSAPAGQEQVSPRRVAALEKRVTTLQRNVSTLQRNLREVTTVANTLGQCLFAQAGAIGVGAFGSQTEGYLYRLANGQQVLTTALDVLAQNEVTAQSPFMLVTNQTCANAINSGRMAPLAANLRGAKPDVADLARTR